MSNEVKLSVVVPAYLEAKNLAVILPQLKQVLTNYGISHEIVIVDTMTAKDNTEQVCIENGVVFVRREGGNFYGDAVRTGIAKSRGEYILFMDADGSHTPEFLPSLLDVRETFDIVVASRYIRGGGTENPASLILMSRVLNIMYSLVLGIRCKDVSNSFKLYRGNVARSLKLVCQNFDIVEELLVKYLIAAPRATIGEIPFVFKKRVFGETKRNLIAFVFSFYWTLMRLFLFRMAARMHTLFGGQKSNVTIV